jgi:hypothetical protein
LRIVLMFAERAWTIPVAVLVLGGCSVYDASLLSTDQAVADGAGGSTGTSAGTSGDTGVSAGASGMGASAAGVGAGESGTGGSSSAGVAGAAAGTAGAAMGDASAAGASGAAGTSAVGGTGGALGGLALDLIDDMEDDDAVIDYDGSGRDGDWYVGDDMTAGGTQFPTPPAFMMSALDQTDPRYPASKYAAMTKGSGFTLWGEDMGFNMKLVDVGTGKHPPYDASAYCGLHLFGKVGTGAGSEVLLRVPDKNSHPDGGVCGSSEKPCDLHYQKQETFGTSWQEYSVLFTDLTRSGWGPITFQVTAIYGVEFGLLPNTKFELWVDDISFLKKPTSGVCPTAL